MSEKKEEQFNYLCQNCNSKIIELKCIESEKEKVKWICPFCFSDKTISLQVENNNSISYNYERIQSAYYNRILIKQPIINEVKLCLFIWIIIIIGTITYSITFNPLYTCLNILLTIVFLNIFR